MILNRTGAEFIYEDVTYHIGDRVLANGESAYEGLFGTISEIRDGYDKETDNDKPDIHCIFMPPVLPKDISALESRFSSLYGQPKALDDITLDEVIMAPEMIRIIPLASCQTVQVYLVREQWVLDGDSGEAVYPVLDSDHARLQFTELINTDKEEGCMSHWTGRVDIEQESTDTCYECWLHDEFCENHYKVTIETHTLQLSGDNFVSLGKAYIDNKLREHFAEQIEDWEEISDLSQEQLTQMIAQPSVPERIRKQLQENGYLEESYWESVSEASFAIVNAFVKQIGTGGAK